MESFAEVNVTSCWNEHKAYETPQAYLDIGTGSDDVQQGGDLVGFSVSFPLWMSISRQREDAGDVAYYGHKLAGGATVLDEVIYMQVRLFRMFLEHTGLPSREGNRVFCDAGVWDFISSCYDSLHLSGDESALNDVFARIEYARVSW